MLGRPIEAAREERNHDYSPEEFSDQYLRPAARALARQIDQDLTLAMYNTSPSMLIRSYNV